MYKLFLSLIAGTLVAYFGSQAKLPETEVLQIVQAEGSTPTVSPSPEVEVIAHNIPQPATPYPIGCEKYRYLVEKYSWNISTAMAVMKAESGCNPNASNMNDRHYDAKGKLICVGSFGLFQVSCHGGKIFDPAQNVQAAWEKYKARGWQPWSATTCRYKVKCI